MNLTFGTGIWTALYITITTWRRARRSREQTAALESSLNRARLKALEAQMNPHFLFNCLNSLRGMIDENPRHAQDMVTRLANILRHNLTRSTETTETLAGQVEVMSDYLALEAVRFDERLRTQVAIDPATRDCAVPAMLLQTLVENAIKHGIAHLPDGGEIVIQSRLADDVLELIVENTGVLAPSPSHSTRVGLANLRERLQMLYGPSATLELTALAPDRVRARVRLPAGPTPFR
jgi:LytS/YehU family sensor histidine kinase